MSKKSQRTHKRVKKVSRSVFGDFCDSFLTLWAWRPGKSFLGIPGLGGVETLVYGSFHRNTKSNQLRVTALLLLRSSYHWLSQLQSTLPSLCRWNGAVLARSGAATCVRRLPVHHRVRTLPLYEMQLGKGKGVITKRGLSAGDRISRTPLGTKILPT